MEFDKKLEKRIMCHALGQVLGGCLKRAGLTHAKVAERSGISPAKLSRILAGSVSLDLPDLAVLAPIAGTTPERLTSAVSLLVADKAYRTTLMSLWETEEALRNIEQAMVEKGKRLLAELKSSTAQ